MKESNYVIIKVHYTPDNVDALKLKKGAIYNLFY